MEGSWAEKFPSLLLLWTTIRRGFFSEHFKQNPLSQADSLAWVSHLLCLILAHCNLVAIKTMYYSSLKLLSFCTCFTSLSDLPPLPRACIFHIKRHCFHSWVRVHFLEALCLDQNQTLWPLPSSLTLESAFPSLWTLAQPPPSAAWWRCHVLSFLLKVLYGALSCLPCGSLMSHLGSVPWHRSCTNWFRRYILMLPWCKHFFFTCENPPHLAWWLLFGLSVFPLGWEVFHSCTSSTWHNSWHIRAW